MCLPGKTHSNRTGETLADLSLDGAENEIPEASHPASVATGVVVGWGSVEQHGETGASRRFLKEMSRRRNEQGLNETDWASGSQWKSLGSMDDVLRLRKVELPFIGRSTCEQWYASRGRPISLIEHQFCAGLFEGGKDACRVRLLL